MKQFDSACFCYCLASSGEVQFKNYELLLGSSETANKKKQPLYDS